MAENRRFELDEARIAADVRSAPAAKWGNPDRMRLQQWLRSLLYAAILMLVVLPLLRSGGFGDLDPQRPVLWFSLAFTLVFAATNVLFTDRMTRRSRADPERYASELQAEVERFTTRGWVVRTLTLGVKLGLGIGVPVGLLIALLLGGTFASATDRVAAAAYFLGLTLAWTIPAAFAIRWLSLSRLKRYRAASE